MDGNIDPNIDPTIESHGGIFNINGDEDGYNSSNDVDFSVQSSQNYLSSIDDSNNSGANTSNGAVSLSSLMNFNQSPTNSKSKSNSEELSLIQSALSMSDQSAAAAVAAAAVVANHQLNQGSMEKPLDKPKQKILNSDEKSQVSIVVVDPTSTEGSRRLGRPRKNRIVTPKSNQSTSSQNFNESVLSRFRFDSLPVVGPGSRGGRRKKNNIVTKPGRQFRFEKNTKNLKLVFENGNGDKEFVVIEKPEHSESEREETPSKSETPSTETTFINLTPQQVIKPPVKTISKRKLNYINKKNSQSSIVPIATEVISELAPDYSSDSSKLALGFPIKPAPHAKDLFVILEFLSKFKAIFKEFQGLTAENLEHGLKLAPTSNPYSKCKNANQTTGKTQSSYKDSKPSEIVEKLFQRLLTLVLNRKRPIERNGVSRALEELKVQVLGFGLPCEWRDDTNLFKKTKFDNLQEFKPVDPSMKEFLEYDVYTFGHSLPIENTPFDDINFLNNGLIDLDPEDRLILFKSLIYWSLSHSDVVKNELNVILNNQELTTEKETFYVSKYLKQGDEIKVVDDNLNISRHDSNFRLLDFFLGDLGQNGRYYLSWANNNQCSIEYLLKNPSYLKNQKFKLYVEDVFHLNFQIFTKQYSHLDDSNEFDERWYLVAENIHELQEFIEFLSSQKNLSKAEKHFIEVLNKVVTVLSCKEVLDRASRRKPAQVVENESAAVNGKEDEVQDEEEEPEDDIMLDIGPEDEGEDYQDDGLDEEDD